MVSELNIEKFRRNISIDFSECIEVDLIAVDGMDKLKREIKFNENSFPPRNLSSARPSSRALLISLANGDEICDKVPLLAI